MSAAPIDPPAMARWLLCLVLPPTGFDALLGDLDEEFAERLVAGAPRGEVRRWYWSQVTRSVPPLLGFRLAELWRPRSARAHAEACALLLVVFGLGLLVVDRVLSHDPGVGPARVAYPLTLLVATAIACRVAARRARPADGFAAIVISGAFATALVVLLMTSCVDEPPIGVWLIWASAALIGTTLGAITIGSAERLRR